MVFGLSAAWVSIAPLYLYLGKWIRIWVVWVCMYVPASLGLHLHRRENRHIPFIQHIPMHINFHSRTYTYLGGIYEVDFKGSMLLFLLGALVSGLGLFSLYDTLAGQKRRELVKHRYIWCMIYTVYGVMCMVYGTYVIYSDLGFYVVYGEYLLSNFSSHSSAIQHHPQHLPRLAHPSPSLRVVLYKRAFYVDFYSGRHLHL
ncbi:hypothetical protein EON63_20675 [archaeon]|nr:MAG: hypothetical protein EON63_20675 [archaeon]